MAYVQTRFIARQGRGRHNFVCLQDCKIGDAVAECMVGFVNRRRKTKAPLPGMLDRLKGTCDQIKSNQARRDDAERKTLRDCLRNRDRYRRDLEALQDAIEAGIGDGTGILADQVFTELRARCADKS